MNSSKPSGSDPERPAARRRPEELRRYVHGTDNREHLNHLATACDVVVEARGTFCPEPVIRTQNAAREMSDGQVAMVVADDGGVELDLPAWCMSTGNEYLGVLREEKFLRVFVRRINRSGR